MDQSRILLWYRNDQRLHDHSPLDQALLAQPLYLIPLYCFDPRHFSKTAFGFPKTGAFRAQFLLESVADLRQGWRSRNSDLLIRMGKPEEIIPELVKALSLTQVYFYQEPMAEEKAIERSLERALKPLGVEIKTFWGHTLYHPNNLPFKVNELPELFTSFRKEVEKSSRVQPALPAPSQVPPLPVVEVGDLPKLSELNLETPELDDRAVLKFQGGESAAIARLKQYFWQQDHLKVYKETRNGMKGADYSSKFSPWLSLGCLSPRYIYEQVKTYEKERVCNDSTYWLIFELLWRDYFRFIAAKHGDRLFHAPGLQGISIPWKQDRQKFECWCLGKTGFPLVDANMRELAKTGFMSNRGRQNVASFLTKNLGIDWRMGAEWFESLLIDYDVCSNWGNWNYTAGVGNDARGFRFFNIIKQSKDYDPQGEYIKHWLPELARIPAPKVHEPWKLLPIEQERFAVKIGTTYPAPIVDLFQSAQAQEQVYNRAIGGVKGRSARGR
ncbi:MAG: DASH family cryptochrome [Leptolyngbyaceae cyanobacterium CSU_1_4]|nr:DASH family cryptochrome [Leptolyngbyaceae cyanobacterium CSU_1_4]